MKWISWREKTTTKNQIPVYTGTMESSRLWTRVLFCAALLSIVLGAEIDDSDSEINLDTRALRDFYPKDPNLTNEKQLVSLFYK